MEQYRKGLSIWSRSLGISSSLLNNRTPTILSWIPKEDFNTSDISSRFIIIHRRISGRDGISHLRSGAGFKGDGDGALNDFRLCQKWDYERRSVIGCNEGKIGGFRPLGIPRDSGRRYCPRHPSKLPRPLSCSRWMCSCSRRDLQRYHFQFRFGSWLWPLL